MPLLPGAEPYAHEGGPVGVLVLHGFTGCPQSIRPWAEYLAAEGLTVSAPRLPGHGTRWQDLQLTRWQDWYGEAERAFDALRSQCEQVFVMGLSMGGTLTLRLAEERASEVAGIVLVNPSLFSLNKLAKLAPLLKFLVPSVKGIGSDIKAPNMKELAYERVPAKAFMSLTEMWKLTRADLGKITAPTLLCHSEDDHVVEPQNSEALLAEIGSSDVREIVLHESYHVATLDNDRETIFRESLAFVRAHAGAVA